MELPIVVLCLPVSGVEQFFFFTVGDWCHLLPGTAPGGGGTTGRLNIWLPLKPIFFKHFWPGTGFVKLFEGACPN
jgi:hypothetical protein